MRKKVIPPAQHPCDAPECAAKLLHDFYPENPELADMLLWEFTCFPMDCKQAGPQAREIIEDVRVARAMAL